MEHYLHILGFRVYAKQLSSSFDQLQRFAEDFVQMQLELSDCYVWFLIWVCGCKILDFQICRRRGWVMLNILILMFGFLVALVVNPQTCWRETRNYVETIPFVGEELCAKAHPKLASCGTN
jgi:hypothetical protein